MNDDNNIECRESENEISNNSNQNNSINMNRKNSTSSECLEDILCNIATISRCEADLFCASTDKIKRGLRRSRNIQELRAYFNMIECLFNSNAVSEKSHAELINSFCNCHKSDCKCCGKE